MANDYSGFFLQGLAGGIQTGMNMGTQLQEMKWQKKQRKQLEETQAKMLEAGNIWNAKIKEVTADNTVTDEEIAQLNTVFLSGGYEFMEHYSSAMNYITGMKDKEYKQEIEWINLFISGIEGLAPGDVQAAYDYIKPKITSEKGLNMLEAYTNMQKKRYEVAQAQPTAEVFSTAGATQEAYPGAGYEYSATAKGYVPTYQKPTTETPTTPKATDYNTAASYLSKFVNAKPEVFEQVKAGLQKNTGLDLSGITQESLREPKAAGKPRVTSLPQLEEYRDKALDADSWGEAEKIINDYTEAGYDTSQLGVTKEAWANSQKEYLGNVKTALDNLVDEKGWLKKGEFTKDQIGLDYAGKKTSEEIYETLRKSYMEYRDKLEKMGVDVSQFPKIKPLSEIEKVGFVEGLKTFGGVGKGQYKSIYY